MIVLWTDGLIYLLLSMLIWFCWNITRQPYLLAAWGKLLARPLYMVAIVILAAYIIIGLLDSIHFLDSNSDIKSILDLILAPITDSLEVTYLAPFAGSSVLLSAIIKKISFGLALGFCIWLVLRLMFLKKVKNNSFWYTSLIIICIWSACLVLIQDYHIFGTDKTGQDVFYIAVKSIRTGLVIGTLTTLIMLPFAVFMGTISGYFRGRVDTVIQYIYTTLSSIPAVLLIAATILTLQVILDRNSSQFVTILERSDLRLLLLCVILGVTSWTSLCRLLRGETLKICQLDYIKAALTLRINSFKIIIKHVIPNVTHIIVIAIAMDFSGLVLAEAILSYVGVGVDPATLSWGNMINAARLEVTREPVVWWSLTGAFVLMFTLVLAANIVADGVRQVLDPRA